MDHLIFLAFLGAMVYVLVEGLKILALMALETLKFIWEALVVAWMIIMVW